LPVPVACGRTWLPGSVDIRTMRKAGTCSMHTTKFLSSLARLEDSWLTSVNTSRKGRASGPRLSRDEEARANALRSSLYLRIRGF